MKDEHAQFSGSIPAAYDRYLGPMLFQPYAEDLAARLQVEENGSVLELAWIGKSGSNLNIWLRCRDSLKC